MSELVCYYELREDNGDGRSTRVIGRVTTRRLADIWVDNNQWRSYNVVSFRVHDSIEDLTREIESEEIKKILSKLTPEESVKIRNFYTK
jgi:hypothetical protein